MSDINAFKNYGIKTPRFTLNNINTYGRLVDIIDGDSLSIILPIYNDYFKFNVRLNGIDTSELHSHKEELRHFAENAKNELVKLIIKTDNLTKHEVQEILDNKLIVVWVECLEFDKYGRLLANVYCFNEHTNDYDISLSQYLLDNKFAYMYNGGTKLSESEQLLLKNN
jgi:endonuclease YncB( thermonuclease family)